MIQASKEWTPSVSKGTGHRCSVSLQGVVCRQNLLSQRNRAGVIQVKMATKIIVNSTVQALLQCHKRLLMNDVYDNKEHAKNKSCAAMLFDKKLKKRTLELYHACRNVWARGKWQICVYYGRSSGNHLSNAYDSDCYFHWNVINAT